MYLTWGYRHCRRTSGGPFRGVIHVYVVPTCSVSPQKNARARGTLGSKPDEPTRSPNDTMMTMGRSLRPLRSSAAPTGKRSIPQVMLSQGRDCGASSSWCAQMEYVLSA